MTDDSMRVGVIGVGNMGQGMALRLVEAGWRVTVRDLLPAREAPVLAAGGTCAPDAAALAAHCDVVIVVVIDAAQVHEVLFGARGVVHAPRRPAAVMLCPTIGPGDVEQAAAQLAAHGIACIDAPISGGPARARDGTMSLMVACDDALFARHESLLRTLGSRLFRIGARPGDGARTKLVNNLLAAINLAGAAEAIALAEHLGLDARRTLEVIEQSSGQSWIGSDRMARALRGDFAPRAHTTLLAKDSALAMAMAQAAGVAPVLGGDAAALFRAACDAGFAAADDASLLRYLRAGAGKPPAG
ncbi:NAD(P)-dependent oxidoreductase [Aquabacterium humicola]|uniref:NAD(P)-dependent oxidoreductase n=1 Tax=Aquabacterium humicola TaxID=3237377 RepID=UPI0025436DF1|nr:NAD(P)-dependent oxidoreductase [Rubrivivax pictus]